jgi:hypothetical protein
MMEGANTSFVTINAFDSNDYYLFKAKPAPTGNYDIAISYYESPQASFAVRDLKVEPGKEAIVTLDSGIAIKKPADQQDVKGSSRQY